MKTEFKPIHCPRRVWPGVLILVILLACATSRAESVVFSVHNLSVSGPGTNRATAEMDVCIFCHTSHRSAGATPLWNHNSSSVSNYTVYSSPTLDAIGLTIPQPNGASRLCLSCHDGTVALGSVSSRATPITLRNGVTTMPAGPSNLGTDLSGDHPISFVFDHDLMNKDSQLKDPASLTGKVRLDGSGRMQCTACHNAHDNQFGNFLVMDNTGSAICLSCHSPETWPTSVHALSSAPSPKIVATKGGVNSLAKTQPKTTTVSAMGCASCHSNHKAGARQHLMKFESPEDNCLSCHDGTVTKKNLSADLKKNSAHSTAFSGREHDSTEDPVNPKSRHAVCADCHNSHAANSTPAAAPHASGALAGVSGVTALGGLIKNIEMEYELCFRCHGDSVQRGPAVVTRQFDQTNKRLAFSTANQSFHPVVAPGRNHNVPSLIAPWKTTSLTYCTDCHNSDTGPNAGGQGPNGPHGSRFAPMLERQLLTTDSTPESPANYALCYKCHSRASILGDQSWKGHSRHILRPGKQAACTTCHDSHGVSGNPNLINFNTLYVSAPPGQIISYSNTGPGRDNCTLTCHDKNHDSNLKY